VGLHLGWNWKVCPSKALAMSGTELRPRVGLDNLKDGGPCLSYDRNPRCPLVASRVRASSPPRAPQQSTAHFGLQLQRLVGALPSWAAYAATARPLPSGPLQLPVHTAAKLDDLVTWPLDPSRRKGLALVRRGAPKPFGRSLVCALWAHACGPLLKNPRRLRASPPDLAPTLNDCDATSAAALTGTGRRSLKAGRAHAE